MMLLATTTAPGITIWRGGTLRVNQAVSLAPNDAGTIETRAEIFEKLGQRDKAIADYRQSLLLGSMKRALEGLKRLDVN
jgi:predicted TPR repeat methyltransferase